jgi:hypothetical protein
MTANSSDLGATHAAMVAASNRRHIHVDTLDALNTYWQHANSRRSLCVGSRDEIRDGQRFGLGGLSWVLFDRDVVVTAITGEDDALPDLPVVRAGWPFAFVSDRLEAAA